MTTPDSSETPQPSRARLSAFLGGWARFQSKGGDSPDDAESPAGAPDAAGGAAEAVYTPKPEHVVLPLGPDGGASQVLRDGVRVVVGPEETARMKGEDLFLGYVAKALGAETRAVRVRSASR